jgi:type I restriction enzyme R subunit
VANKFQTGFDQPLLCGMYVDKRWRHPGGADAVAPEPRAPGQGHHLHPRLRERPEEVLAAFKTYYETAELEA